jgi:NADP-dependent 3-hydroxy acid dehydrogenase YdfG
LSKTLEGKVAVVTGASSGIGESAALALAENGAKVAVSGRRADRLDALVKRIEAAGGAAIALPGDLTQESVATGIVTDTVKRWGRLDILVNSAGVIQVGSVENADLDEWRRVININLLASLYTSRAAIGPMRAQGSGDIVNISSTAGRRASAVFGPYATSKFGLMAMTEGMRQEVGGYGIRVCSVAPGATNTNLWEGISEPGMRSSVQKLAQRVGSVMPADIAAAIVFVVTLPSRANVSELLIRPTADTAPL